MIAFKSITQFLKQCNSLAKQMGINLKSVANRAKCKNSIYFLDIIKGTATAETRRIDRMTGINEIHHFRKTHHIWA